MEKKPYYLAYEERYQKVYEAGADRWGYSPDDDGLISTLARWVEEHQLKGKRIIEFACGEGASGVILSQLGCIYHGVDIAPSAIAMARTALESYPNATVSLLDMVRQQAGGTYDAALDVMGFHMLVTDRDRADYLKNAFACLRCGAPMLFFNESYRDDAFEGEVNSIEQWIAFHNLDLETPERRAAKCNGKEVEVYIPILAARSRTRSGYELEMALAGFVMDRFQIMEANENIHYSASIYVHKP